MTPLTIQVEVVDANELARRWSVPVAWVKNRIRKDCPDRIPRVKLGRHVRFEYGGEELREWWERHKHQ